MAYRVHQTNKKTGITYVYEGVSFWDKEKKQARNKQVCIGKVDAGTGDFIPSKRFTPEQAAVRDLSVTASAEIVGPSIVLDAVTEQLGIEKLLKSCFPQDYQQILTMAYYLVARGGPLCHCEKWSLNHAHPLGAQLKSQRISEILGSITIDGKQSFLTKWMTKIMEHDYLCYDITSVSSYSELNEYIKFGHNRDNEKLPQLNLAMLFGQKSCLPVYFQRMPGNITDVTTLNNILKTFKAMELHSLNFVMDKGFYSQKNIDQLLDSRTRFTLAVPLNNKWVLHAIDNIYETIHGPQGYQKIDDEILYIHSQLYPWGEKKRRCYLHLYYNAYKRAEAVDRFNEQLVKYKEEIESGMTIKEHLEDYKAFFVVTSTPKRGVKASYNTEAISQYINRYAGFQAILTNDIKNPLKTLQVYRDKDVVEKCFDDLKNQLDMKRLRVHSSEAADGRFFIQFIALIYVSALRKKMRASNLLEHYTVRELLYEMETLTKVKYSGKYGHILTEVTKSQRQILKELEIELPG